MPAVALKGGNSLVVCTDGAKGSQCASDPPRWNWNVGITSASDGGSSTVFVNNIGVVREGDAMQSHPWGEPCTPSPINHTPVMNTFIGSPNVYVEGKLVARVGDKYNSESFDHTVATGSSTVFIG